MPVKAFQITRNENLDLHISASTLDEMTGALPQGFYTTFNTLSGGTKVLGLRLHLERLYSPARKMGLAPAVDEATLRARIALLVKENLPGESRVRLILTKGSGALYVGIEYFQSLPEVFYSNGVNVITTELARQTPRLKDTGFILSSTFERGQIGKSVFEVLLTKKGKILEGMTSNFYGIKGKSLVTARRGILLGVTRKVVLRLARGQGMTIAYRSPRIHEKLGEAFLTSSSRGIVPIISIDGQTVGEGRVGPATQRLSKAYQVYVEERSEFLIQQ